MTRVAIKSGEPVEIHPRKRFSLLIRDQVCARQDNQCAGRDCLAELYPEPFEVDHVIPLALGGSNDLSNLEGLCSDCHRIKTRQDVKAIAKAKRLAGETCTGSKRPIPSRPFPKSKTKWPSRKFEKRAR